MLFFKKKYNNFPLKRNGVWQGFIKWVDTGTLGKREEEEEEEEGC
jgi:hypothetical protein